MLYIIAIFLLIVLITIAYPAVIGAPWVPTHKTDIQRILKLADIKDGHNFYDLGSGDGRLIAAAADKGANSKGFELASVFYLISKIRNIKRKKAITNYKNFYNSDLSNADIVYFFLMPKHYSKIKKKLENELKPGTKVIAYVWPIPEWQPIQIDKQEKKPNLYLYEI